MAIPPFPKNKFGGDGSYTFFRTGRGLNLGIRCRRRESTEKTQQILTPNIMALELLAITETTRISVVVSVGWGAYWWRTGGIVAEKSVPPTS